MRIPWKLRNWLYRRAGKIMSKRPPDFIIRPGGPDSGDYLRRWFVIPRNPVFNIYLHDIVKSDDDRALHDHPWTNCSIVLAGMYVEHTIAPGGVHHRTVRRAGDMVWRGAKAAHRLEIMPGSDALTLFITGPRLREWGFHCPQGWRPHHVFTAGPRGEFTGRGCD